MDTAILVGDVSVLDRYQVRNAVLRIPEVSIRLKELQSLLDRWCHNSVDLFTTLQHDDITFSRMGSVRGAIVMAVQLGLFDRYKRMNGQPVLLIGSKGNLPLLRVLAGNIQMSDVLQKLFDEEAKGISMIAPQSRGAFDIVRVSQEIQFIDSLASTTDELVSLLVEEQNIKRIVNLGPGSRLESYMVDPTYEHVTVVESIDMDPWLGWFFASTKSA